MTKKEKINQLEEKIELLDMKIHLLEMNIELMEKKDAPNYIPYPVYPQQPMYHPGFTTSIQDTIIHKILLG